MKRLNRKLLALTTSSMALALAAPTVASAQSEVEELVVTARKRKAVCFCCA